MHVLVTNEAMLRQHRRYLESGRRAAPVMRRLRRPCTVGMPTWRAVCNKRTEANQHRLRRGVVGGRSTVFGRRQAQRLEVSKLSKFRGYNVQTSPRGAPGPRTLVS